MSVGLILDALSWALFSAGSLIVIGGAIGLVRFPDFYTRMHAVGMTDTFGTELLLLGMALQAGSMGEVFKLFLIALFMLLTSPVATHATGHAAYVKRMQPLVGKELKHVSFRQQDKAG